MGTDGVVDQPWLRRLSAVEFSAASGAVHYVLAWVGLVVAFWGASGLGQGLFFVFVGYFAAFSVWALLRTLALEAYLSVRPQRNAASLALHLACGLFALVLGVVLGMFGLGIGLVVAAFVVPALSTRWAIGDEGAGAGQRRGVLGGVALAGLLMVFAFASVVLMLIALVGLSPG